MNFKYYAMALAALTIMSCNKKDDKSAAKTDETVEVKLATVTSEDIPQTEVFTATVESDVKNNISPNIAYRIEKILVEVGDNVSAGQCVAVLDASSAEQTKLQIESQKIVLDNQQVDFNRISELYNIGGISKAEYDNAKVQLESAQRQLKVLQTQYNQLVRNTRITTPISGVVTARNYDNGDMYSGQPIITVEKTNPVKLICKVSETHYKDVKVGDVATITLDAYEGEVFDGKVTIVYPEIDQTTHTFSVEITITNRDQKVRPGMFARAELNFGSQNHVLVPDEALVKQIGAGDRYVYVYNAEKGTVSYNKVQLGKHIGDNYEIFSGVNPGDQVVTAGQARLANGKKVKVVK